MAELAGPAQLVLLASVARLYYLDGKSKVEIADELKLSRFKVARLLDEARATGMVRIEIGHPGTVDVDLSGLLRNRYGLQHAVVVDTADEDPGLLRAQIGRAGADLLTEIVKNGDVLGLGWARSLLDMAAAVSRLAQCSVVQLTGALSRPDVHASSIDLVRDVARAAQGPAYFYYAPMILPDATTAAVLRQQPEIAQAIARFPMVTKAVLGIGSWNPPYSTVSDALSPAERAALLELGVATDLSGVLLDENGHPVDAPLSRRMICISAEQLRQIPEVIALTYDSSTARATASKARAVRAAVRGGFVNGIVTHTSLAKALIDIAGD
jgi:DNA-binding transcriptional regulator LsrR (DeoR family)